MLRHALRRVDPALYHRDDGAGALRLKWLGTAGFILDAPSRTVVLDPYVSRPGVAAHLGRLRSDEALVERLIPQADEVLIGHSHYDHILDAPSVCRRTGARLIGSPATCHVGRAAGLPEHQLVATLGGEDIPCGDELVAHGLPSNHGRAYLNRVPLAGDITEPPEWPPHAWDLRHGQVLNWWIRGHGVSVVHVDSAEFFTETFERVGAHGCDVLCLCAIGRRYRPRYVEEAVRLLKPRYVVPCHWDYFLRPYDEEPRQLPQADVEGFLDELRAVGAEARLLPIGGYFSFNPAP